MLLGGFTIACGDDDSSGDPDGGDTDTDTDTDSDTDTDTDTGTGIPDHDTDMTGPCPFEDKVGWFKVEHHPIYSAVTGEVSDGVVPATIPFPQESEGDCELLQRINPQCDPPCESGYTCDFDGECIDYPTKLDVGDVLVAGLEEDVVLTPDTMNNYYNTTVPSPPFADGAEIIAYAYGNETEEFVLDGRGMAVLEMDDPMWTMVYDTPLEISWTPSDGEARIWATFNVDQHGNSPVTMFCDLEDTGTATIPVLLVNALIDWGVSGFASGHLYRRTVDSEVISVGCVELEVFSHVEAQLSVGTK
jgi:hypothetical protein